MKTTILEKQWQEAHGDRYGAPAGVDDMLMTFTHHVFNGKTYQTETLIGNGVVWNKSEYPAGTLYARQRLALYGGNA